MSFRGLHLAISDSELTRLCALNPADRPDHVSEVLEEEKCGTVDACETDKSWAYIHAALNECDPEGAIEIPSKRSGGLLKRLFGRSDDDQLAKARFAVMGMDPLFASDEFYIGLVPRSEVRGVATALNQISKEELAARLIQLHQQFAAKRPAGEAADYAMGWYPGLVEFYDRAAAAGKNVIFTVDY